MKKVNRISAFWIKGTGFAQTGKEMGQGQDGVIAKAAPVTLVDKNINCGDRAPLRDLPTVQTRACPQLL